MILDIQAREYWDAFSGLSGELQDLDYLQRTKAADAEVQEQLMKIRKAMEAVPEYEKFWHRRATDFNERQGREVENPDWIVEQYRKVAPPQVVEKLNLLARSLREQARGDKLNIDEIRKKIADAGQLIHGEYCSLVIRLAMKQKIDWSRYAIHLPTLNQ
ncbi:MAG: hypothetical protein AAB853_01050 [Patescibacteria group bacterium]